MQVTTLQIYKHKNERIDDDRRKNQANRKLIITPLTNCWICGTAADSSEHRIKKADIVRAYGKGPYKGSSAPVHVRGEVVSPIQGPRASTLKYEHLLCHACNTKRTQPSDKAYDRFIDWILENEQAILLNRLINFEEIFGIAHEECQLNLFRYFVKSFGCRLAEARQSVPTDLVNLLIPTNFLHRLRLTFSVNEDVLLLPEQDRAGFVGKGDLTCQRSRTDPSIIYSYCWNEHVSWFTIWYWYDCKPEEGLGSTWTSNSQNLYLGRHAPLSAEQRDGLLHKIR